MIDVETCNLGGGALARAAIAHDVPAGWYTSVPDSPAEWREAAQRVVADFADRDWLTALAPAFAARGAAAARLERSARGQGIVVTTGQQPGLFGGPVYTWSKAFTALALADAIERATGIPTAPVFWAATDDTDFTEARTTMVARGGQVHELRLSDRATGLPMAELPLGDVQDLYGQLAQAAGSAVDAEPLQHVRDSYRADQTIGGAYVTLLRSMLEPLGIAVLDAAHPAVRTAGEPVLRSALRSADAVTRALRERGAEIDASGYKTQVQIVPNLSLVFQREGEARTRVPSKRGPSIAETAAAESLGPNVLLRPVMERYILPTVTYIAGPGELAYFAQVSAVAQTLSLAAPRVVPRWSGRIIEPHVRDILSRIRATPDDFRDPHAVESRIAREELPATVRTALAELRRSVQLQGAALRAGDTGTIGLQKVVAGFEAQVEYRIARLERRYAAAIKRTGSALLQDVATARASLYPNGAPQERALNLIPMLARYGTIVRDRMIDAARTHATALVGRD